MSSTQDYLPERAEIPTQVAHPWRATLRTGVAVLLAAAIVVPTVWNIVAEEILKAGGIIPPGVEKFIAILIASLGALASIVTRVMAIPQISNLLSKIGLGPNGQSNAA